LKNAACLAEGELFAKALLDVVEHFSTFVGIELKQLIFKVLKLLLFNGVIKLDELVPFVAPPIKLLQFSKLLKDVLIFFESNSLIH
jgi:hypothetical protein